MAETCETCRFSRAYPAPTGDEPEMPKLTPRKWWQSPPMFDVGFDRQFHVALAWRGQARRAKTKVECCLNPNAVEKPKQGWCGHFEARSGT